MSTTDQAKDKLQHAKGTVKEGLGRVTGDQDLQAEGQGDQAAADAKSLLHRAGDGVKHAAEAVAGKAKEVAGGLSGDDALKDQGEAEQTVAESKARREA